MSGRDLFGHSAPPAAVSRPNDLVSIAFDVVEAGCTDKAWCLIKPGQGEGRHAPRSRCHRGVGPLINHWTMPRWLAAQNGWL